MDIIAKLKKSKELNNNQSSEKITDANDNNELADINEYNYTLWYHNPNDTNFGEESFKKVYNIKNRYQLLGMHKSLSSTTNNKLLLNGAFYLMKDDILPIWSSETHIKGGCISWKIDRTQSIKCWENLLLLFVSNKFNNLEKYNITGISINPKKNCNILKIWFKNVIPHHVLSNLPIPKECYFRDKFKMFKIFETFIK